MPDTRFDNLPGSFGWAAPLNLLVVYPPNDNTKYLNDGDPQLRTVGTDLVGGVIATAPLPPCCGFHISYIDAAGSTSTMTFDVSGTNQFGEAVSETIVIPTGAGTKRVPSTYAYRSIDHIVVTATAGTDAADTLQVGFFAGAAGANASRVVMGLPVKLRDASQQQACTEFGPVGTAGTRRAVAGTDIVKHTFVMLDSETDTITGGKTLQCRFKTDAII